MIFSGSQSKFKIKSINFIAQVQEIIINWFFQVNAKNFKQGSAQKVSF